MKRIDMNFLMSQYKQLAEGGFPVLIKKARKTVFLGIAALFIPVIFIVRVLRPVVLIRFGPLRSNRIGHFALNTEVYLCNRDHWGPKKVIDLFYHLKPICNTQLRTMWERILLVSPIIEVLHTANSLLPDYELHETPVMQSALDHRNFMATTKPHLNFTSDEEKKGMNGLRKLGIPEGAAFICFSNRDAVYLNAVQPGIDWTYHDVRNSKIASYLPAVEAMTHRGYYGVRMGSLVKEPVRTDNPMIIDYATNGRSDFMDIFLCAKAKMYLGDTAGIHTVSKIFRVPIVYTNIARFSLVELDYLSFNALFIPKMIWSAHEDRSLTFKEMLNLENIPPLSFDRYCVEHGLSIVDNTTEEIAELAVEWEERRRGVFKESQDDTELQKLFWKECQREHIHEKKKARIGTQFLRDNASLLAQAAHR
jgi:putative glycosyltransferase (TIGR04372 family)